MDAERKNRSRKREGGQALVEFVLVFSIMLTLFCMAVDLARVVDAKILLQSAAGESVRHITTDNAAEMSSEVSEAVENDYDRLDPARLQINVTAGPKQRRNYTYHAHNGHKWDGTPLYVNQNCYFTYFNATVRLTYTVPIITPVGQLFFGKQQVMSTDYTKMVVLGGFQW